MLFEKSYNDLIGESMTNLVANTRLTRVSPGSKTRALLETTNRNINQVYQIFDLNFARAFISGATGKYLDFIGEILGISRLGIETAKVNASSQVIKFFVESGTFGDINNNNPIVLPAGTLISTEDGIKGIVYRVTIGTILSVSTDKQFISAEAVSTGEASNIGSETLKFHNFTNYTDTDNNTLKVLNISGIFNGANIESDINYKFRLSKSTLSSEAANQTACLLAALSVPGVANVVMQNRAFGIGTYKVLIKSVTPTVSNSLIESTEAALAAVSAQGILARADRPAETGMAFVITLTYTSGTSNDEKDLIDNQVRLAITNYVDNLDIGEEFILNELIERILSVSGNIKDLGKPNQPIDESHIYIQTKLQDNKVRQLLLSNYAPAETERLIIEPSLAEPITIIRSN